MQTMEQQRAADTWEKAQRCSEEYMSSSPRGCPLIMNSGLMQVLAFLEEKGAKESQRHCRDLSHHLRTWLQARFANTIPSAAFSPFMQALMQIDDPRTYQAITAEAFAWLRWMRQMAAGFARRRALTMAIAAVPGYMGSDFSSASPGMRFGMYLKLWGTNNRSGTNGYGLRTT